MIYFVCTSINVFYCIQSIWCKSPEITSVGPVKAEVMSVNENNGVCYKSVVYGVTNSLPVVTLSLDFLCLCIVDNRYFFNTKEVFIKYLRQNFTFLDPLSFVTLSYFLRVPINITPRMLNPPYITYAYFVSYLCVHTKIVYWTKLHLSSVILYNKNRNYVHK